MSLTSQKHLILTLALSSYILTAVGNKFNSKKSAFAYGFSTSTIIAAQTLYTFVQIKEAKQELKVFLKSNSQPMTVDLEGIYSWFAAQLSVSMVQRIVRIFESYFLLKPYNKRAVVQLATSNQDHGRYYLIGFVSGLLLLLIVALKYKWLSPSKVKDFIKTLLERPKVEFSTGVKVFYVLSLILAILSLIYIIKVILHPNELKQKLMQLKKTSEKLLKIGESKVLSLFEFIYIISRTKRLNKQTIKILAKEYAATSLSKQIRTKGFSYDQLKQVYDKLPPELKKFVDAVDLVFEKIKFQNLEDQVKKVLKGIYIKKSLQFNAYANPLSKEVTVLFDRHLYPKLTTQQLAAVIAHEIGHILDLHKDKTYYLNIAWYAFYQFVGVINLRYVLTHKFTKVKQNIVIDSVLESVTSFIMLSYGRKAEIAADAFAVKLGFTPSDFEFLLWFDDPAYDLVAQADVHDIPRRRYQAIVDAIYELRKYDNDISKLF